MYPDWYEKYGCNYYSKAKLRESITQTLCGMIPLVDAFSFIRMGQAIDEETDVFWDAHYGGWEFSEDTKRLRTKLSQLVPPPKPLNLRDYL